MLFVSVLVLSISFQSVSAATTVKEAETKAVAVEPKVEVVTPASGLDKAETKLREILGPIYQSLEVFRKKQAEHFVVVRDKTKIKLGINLAEDALERLKPFLAPPTAPSAVPGVGPQEGLEIKKLDNPKDYAALIGSTALASLFSNVWMFYTGIVLLLFFILRFIFRMAV